MKDLAAADREWIRARLDEYARHGTSPARFARYALLLHIAVRNQWVIPDNPFPEPWPEPAEWAWPRPPATVVCPAPGSVAVLPHLDTIQSLVLDRAAQAAVHGRWRLFDREWNEIADRVNLPDAEWVTREVAGFRVSGPANQPGVRLTMGESLW